MFETINPLSLGNPMADGVANIGNILTQAKQRQKEEEFKRAQMLMQQQQQQVENQRADQQMQMQREQHAQQQANHAQEQQQKQAQIFHTLYEASGQDPAHAEQLAKAYGYKVDKPQPDAVDQILAQPAPQLVAPSPAPAGPPMGPNGLEPGYEGPSSTPPPATTQSNMVAGMDIGQPSTPEAPIPQMQESQSAMTARQKLQNAASGRFSLQGPMGSFEIDPAGAKAAQQAEFQQKLDLRNSGPEARMLAQFEEAQRKRDSDHARDEEFKLTAAKQEELRLAAIRAQTLKSGGKKGGGGKGPGYLGGMAELVQMAQAGKDNGEIAGRAAQLGIPAGGKDGWVTPVMSVPRRQATDQRVGDKKEALQVTGPNGEALGTAKSTKAATTLEKSNTSFDQLRTRTQALIQDIEQNGNRVIMPESVQRRESLMAAVAAAGRVYNGLGGTDASQRLEQQIVGAHGTIGHGFLMGANADVVKHTLEEAEHSHAARLGIGLRGGGKGAKANRPATMQTPDGKIHTLQPDGTYL
jgi:hypothetical protein